MDSVEPPPEFDDDSGPKISLAGSIPDFPDITWDDFERASDLASVDLASALAVGEHR